jgi:hypothetical protein
MAGKIHCRILNKSALPPQLYEAIRIGQVINLNLTGRSTIVILFLYFGRSGNINNTISILKNCRTQGYKQVIIIPINQENAGDDKAK